MQAGGVGSSLRSKAKTADRADNCEQMEAKPTRPGSNYCASRARTRHQVKAAFTCWFCRPVSSTVINRQAPSDAFNTTNAPFWSLGTTGHVRKVVWQVCPACDRGIPPDAAIPPDGTTRTACQWRCARRSPRRARQSRTGTAVLLAVVARQQRAVVIGNGGVPFQMRLVCKPVRNAVRLRSPALPQPEPSLSAVSGLGKVQSAMSTHRTMLAYTRDGEEEERSAALHTCSVTALF
jgi:hypothetical protein